MQKFETDANGNLTNTPDPNTQLVPVEVDLPAGYSDATLTCGPGLALWSTSTPSNAADDLGQSVTVSQAKYYVEGLIPGAFKVDLAVTDPSSGDSHQSDEVLFTVVDDETGPCGCCNSGTQPDYTGNVDVDQSNLGGAGDVIRNRLSQGAVSPTYDTTYTVSGLTGYVADSSGGQITSIGNQPHIVAAGAANTNNITADDVSTSSTPTAVVLINGDNVQIWDNISGTFYARENYECGASGNEILDSQVQGTLTEQGGNFVETEIDGTSWMFDGTTGQPVSETPAGGDSSTYSYNGDGSLDNVATQTGPDQTQVAWYYYNAGQVAAVAVTNDTVDNGVTVSSTPVDYAIYDYYGQNDASGSPGQLQMVTTYDGEYDPSNPPSNPPPSDFVNRTLLTAITPPATTTPTIRWATTRIRPTRSDN